MTLKRLLLIASFTSFSLASAATMGVTPDIQYHIQNNLEKPVKLSFSYQDKANNEIVQQALYIKAKGSLKATETGIRAIHVNYSYQPLEKGIPQQDATKTCEVTFAQHGKMDHSKAKVVINQDGSCKVSFK
jgi:hypothetical protein